MVKALKLLNANLVKGITSVEVQKVSPAEEMEIKENGFFIKKIKRNEKDIYVISCYNS